MRKFIFGFVAALSFAACTGSTENASGNAVSEGVKSDGQALFVQNCSACHQKDRDVVGPMLQGALARWGSDKTRLYAFVRNSNETIGKGDVRAVELEGKWGNKMPAFPHLSDKEIEAILKYAD